MATAGETGQHGNFCLIDPMDSNVGSTYGYMNEPRSDFGAELSFNFHRRSTEVGGKAALQNNNAGPGLNAIIHFCILTTLGALD